MLEFVTECLENLPEGEYFEYYSDPFEVPCFNLELDCIIKFQGQEYIFLNYYRGCRSMKLRSLDGRKTYRLQFVRKKRTMIPRFLVIGKIVRRKPDKLKLGDWVLLDERKNTNSKAVAYRIVDLLAGSFLGVENPLTLERSTIRRDQVFLLSDFYRK